VQPNCPSVTTLSACTASFARDRPCNSGWVSMGVAHEAGILTSSPNGAIDHPARSPRRRGPATVAGQAVDDLSDLGGIENGRDHIHPACASGTGHDVQLVHLCEQPRPGFAAGARADLAVQWPALGLILRGPRRRGRLSGLTAIPVHRRSSAEGGVVFPGTPCPRRIQSISAHQVAPTRRDVEGQLGDEVQGREVLLPAPEVSRGAGLPGDSVLFLIPVDLLQ